MGTGEEKKVATDENLACYNLTHEYSALGDLISKFIKAIEV